LTATPEQAQEMHKYIRSLINEEYGKEIAAELTILYGGSCKPSNAAEIFSKPDVDGGLIGGASLKKEDFSAIVEAI
ncbi:MAG TPA: triose-phosphate isomerase, partial [Bacteroidales bacterium]|nr:triose-phosphate isomerase [Bacteroidales bacterium]